MSYSNEQIAPLVRACIGRHNDYAFQRETGQYTRVGQSLTYDLLREHLAGRVTLGTYVIDERGCCRFAVFDADGDDGVLVLLSVQARLATEGIPSYLEGSRRGAHLWLFFARPVPAGEVRGWLISSCPAGVELYPKQDTASYARPGSLIRVPLGVHRRSARRYPFVEQRNGLLVPVARSVVAALSWLSTIERVSLPAALPVLGSSELLGRDEHTKYSSKASLVLAASPGMTVRDWCLAHDPRAVIGRYVELDRRGLGCCPFGWHHAAGRDRHPSLWVHVPRGGDLACWWCHTWQQGGSLFDFLRLYHGLEARDLWRRVLAGEQF